MGRGASSIECALALSFLENNILSFWQSMAGLSDHLQWWSFYEDRNFQRLSYSSKHKTRSVDIFFCFLARTGFSFCDNYCNLCFLFYMQNHFSSPVTTRCKYGRLIFLVKRLFQIVRLCAWFSRKKGHEEPKCPPWMFISQWNSEMHYKRIKFNGKIILDAILYNLNLFLSCLFDT